MHPNEHEWRFRDIVDLDSGRVLFTVEHEVRSLANPLYARPLVNRNPQQSNRAYAPRPGRVPRHLLARKPSQGG